MRQVQEMAVEFANALNAAAAAELELLLNSQSECAKLRRLLEEERKLVQRLRQEKENEAQMVKRKIERMSQRLAEAQKDVEYATTRADVAENEWVKLKRELQGPESEETRQIVLRQVEHKELESANILNAASIAESECDKLRTLLEEERKLVQRLILEKDDEAQLAKRQIEEIGQELADARKNAECAATRADVAENELVELKRELQEAELVQLLKPESEETKQSVLRQVDDKELELANALYAASIAEIISRSECDKLWTLLEEERKLVERLILEKDDEAQLAKRRIEEIGQEVADARKNAECAATRADVAENEWTNAKKELQEEKEPFRLLKLECEEIRRNAMRQVEEKERESVNALHASTEIARCECAKLKRMMEEEQKLVQRLRLEEGDEEQLAMWQIEEIDQELAHTQKDVELARKDADTVKEIHQERVVSRRQPEFNRLSREREERISRILQSRRQEREKMRKLKYYQRLEEERQQKLHEEEEAQKREEAERLKKEEAEILAKLVKIAEKRRQRERELEEKAERQNKQALFGRSGEAAAKPLEPSARPLEDGSTALVGAGIDDFAEAERRKKEEAEILAKLVEIVEKRRQKERELEEKAERQKKEALFGGSGEAAVKPLKLSARPLEAGSTSTAAAATSVPARGKYVPRFRRERAVGTSPAAPPETDRWTNSSKQDGDKWRSDDKIPAFGASGGSKSSSTWSSFRPGSGR